MSRAIPTQFSDGTEGLKVTFQAGGLSGETAGDKLSVKGIAVPFAETYDAPHGNVRFDKKAFDSTLADIDSGANHAFLAADGHELDAMYLLARTNKEGEGSLRLWKEKDGLHFEAEMLNDFIGQAIYKRVEMGILDGVSVGIQLGDFDEDYDEDTDRYDWTHKKVKLREVSLVSYPAFKQTDVKVAPEQMSDEPPEEIKAEGYMAAADKMMENINAQMKAFQSLLDIAKVKMSEEEEDTENVESETELDDTAVDQIDKLYRKEV